VRAVDLIRKKREGQPLSREEIHYLINGFTTGRIPDYQMAAWAMAVCFRGMDEQETAELTEAMVRSGEQVDLSGIDGVVVDKHSTGGVGDTTTLVLAPLVAACGVPVAKMSGKSLGHTGGTIDKLAGIPGFTTQLDRQRFIQQVNRIGLALTSQSESLVPADKRLYALRDVTATVDSIPLIASSIMSKKIASGAQAIVLDVKVGSGAFMKTLEEADELARMMVQLGNRLGRKTAAVISDMNQPLGRAVGSALEVREAILALKGEGDPRLVELCLHLGSLMLLLAGRVPSEKEGRRLLEEALASGQALAKMKQWIAAQGGQPEVVDEPERLPLAAFRRTVRAQEEGYLSRIDTEQVGIAAMMLGAGRNVKEDHLDPSVGLLLEQRLGQYVRPGDPLFTIYSGNEQASEVEALLRKSVHLSKTPPAVSPLIYQTITGPGD